MEITELEKLLDSLKGEDSIFSLFNSGRTEELKSLHDLFIDSATYIPSKLEETLNNAPSWDGRMLVSLTGEPGIGKSTLLSTLLVHNYLAGNIDQLYYLRYNPTSGSFETIFKANQGERSRIVVLDDVHYFLPDFVSNVIVKGRVNQFDKFVSTMQIIDNLYKTGIQNGHRIRTGLVYVTDTFGFKTLKNVFDSVLQRADREDLSPFLPQLPVANTDIKYEVGIDQEFFGKTYAVAGGDPRLYKAATFFGELVREDDGLLATNARLLRHMIGSVRTLSNRLNVRFIENIEAARKVFKGEKIDLSELKSEYTSKLSETLRDLNERVLEVVKNASSDLFVLLGEIERWQEMYERDFKDSNPKSDWRLNDFKRFIVRESEYMSQFSNQSSLLTAGELQTREDIRRELKAQRKIANETLGVVSSFKKDFDTERASLQSHFSNYLNENVFDKAISLKKQGKIASPPIFSNVSPLLKNREANSLDEIIWKRTKDISMTQEFVNTILDSSGARMRYLLESGKRYVRIVRNSRIVDSYQRAYAEIRRSAVEFASSNPSIFSYTTPERELVRKMVDDREGFLERMNPYTIEIIRNLSILPPAKRNF